MRRCLRWSVLLVLVVTLIAVGVTGCSSEKEPYKVGALFAVTGNNSPLGEPEQQTVEMLVDQINEAGGIDGHPLEVVVYDTESDTTKCVTLANRLIDQDGVVAIIGPTSSGESLAIKETVTTAEIPLISCAASYLIVSPVEESYWVFKTPQSDVLAVQAIYDYLDTQGITKIATITDTSGYGAGGKAVLEEEAPSHGITIVSSQTFGVADTDMSAQITQIGGTDAQAIVCWGTNPGPAIIAKNLADDPNVNLPLFESHGIANKEFITLGGDAVNGVIFPAGKLLIADQLPDSDPQKTLLLQYKSDFESLYGEGTANTFGGHAYDALMMVVQALDEVGPDKAAIRDYIENDITDWPGTGGVFNMSPTDHNGLTKGAFVLIKIVDGEWTWLQQ
jgi:branched-chain amino acid transport system substrate-binding protein